MLIPSTEQMELLSEGYKQSSLFCFLVVSFLYSWWFGIKLAEIGQHLEAAATCICGSDSGCSLADCLAYFGSPALDGSLQAGWVLAAKCDFFTQEVLDLIVI